MRTKQATSFRLRPVIIALLKRMVRPDRTATAVVETAIEAQAKREKIEVKK
jgi:hypothetical protein